LVFNGFPFPLIGFVILPKLSLSVIVIVGADFDSSAAPPIPPQPPLKGLASTGSYSAYEPYSVHHSNGDHVDSGTGE